MMKVLHAIINLLLNHTSKAFSEEWPPKTLAQMESFLKLILHPNVEVKRERTRIKVVPNQSLHKKLKINCGK
jgi:hypothetical protein